MDGFLDTHLTKDDAERLLSFSTYATDEDVAHLVCLLSATDGTEEAVVKVLCEQFPDHIRGWFQPVFGIVYAEVVSRFAELYVAGYSIETIRDFFISVAEDRKTLSDEPEAGAE